MRYWKRVGLAAMIAFVWGTFPTQAQETKEDANLQSAFRTDAIEYVKAFGGTVEEATSRLKLQQEVTALDETLQAREPAIFGGLWIQHTPEFKVIVRLTKGTKDVVLPYVNSVELATILEIQPASVSLLDLLDTHAAVIATVSKLDIPIQSKTDIQNGEIEIYTTDPSLIVSRLGKAGETLPANVKLTLVPRLAVSEVNRYGGLNWNGCTAGLSVKNASGTKFGSSAGHCYGTSTDPLSPNTRVDGTYDFVVGTVPAGDTVKNWVRDNVCCDGTAYYRIITTFTPRGSVGTLVCKYGNTTAYTCGTIEDNRYNYKGGTNYVLVKSTSTFDKISCGGDSGAAWFSGTTAHGNHSAGWCDLSATLNKAVFSPNQGFLDYGFSPMTTP